MTIKTLTVALIISSFPGFAWPGIVNGTQSPCDETLSIIRMVVSAKIKYEEAVYFKNRKAKKYYAKYASLVKLFKVKDSLENRKECLRQMLLKDSVSPVDTVAIYSYLSPLSSHIDPCQLMPNSLFLRTLLFNLENTNNDSTLVCIQSR